MTGLPWWSIRSNLPDTRLDSELNSGELPGFGALGRQIVSKMPTAGMHNQRLNLKTR